MRERTARLFLGRLGKFLLTVNLGYNADTTGAVCGRQAGAFHGEHEIPDSRWSTPAHRALIERHVVQLSILRPSVRRLDTVGSPPRLRRIPAL